MTTPGGGGLTGGSAGGGPLSGGQQGTRILVYAPDVNAYIATRSGVIDVSADIVKGQVRRVENSVSQATLVLNNKAEGGGSKGKYSGSIQRMDRIVIFMTRITQLQVFSGYVDTAPLFDLYPTTCTVQASCTLKRLLHVYWDPGLSASQQILDQSAYAGQGASGGAGVSGGAAGAAGGNPNTTSLDSGLGSMLANLLVRVGGWDQNQIKIQDFPQEFLAQAIQTEPDPEARRKALKKMQELLGFNAGGAGGGGAGQPGAGGGGAGGGGAGGQPGAPGGGAGGPQGTDTGGGAPAGNFGGQNLDAEQTANANTIANVGRSRGMNNEQIGTAIGTAAQESNLRNLNYGDRDSQGLFQQRPSQGWGSPAQVTDPVYSSNKFYDGLSGLPGGGSGMSQTQQAQAVQRSAYPDAYAKHMPMANAFAQANGGAGQPPGQPPATPPPGDPAAGGQQPGQPGAEGQPPGGQPPGGSGQAPEGQGGAGAEVPEYAYGLFNSMFFAPAFYNAMSDILGTVPGEEEKALINDQQLMGIVQSVAKAAMRSFQSSPDGQFVAYYPDYFGIQNGAKTMMLEDIEMKNVSVQISDGPLATHVYTVGDSVDPYGGTMTENPFLAFMQTQGFATIENPNLMQMMLQMDTSQGQNQDFTKEAIYQRFGARPLVMSMPMIRSPLLERFQAIYMFMQKWAEQYQTSVETTFMPELFPGMRVELSGHELIVYVKEVTHNFDRKLGFTTDLVIMAPSTSSGGISGMPVSRSGAGEVPLPGPGGGQ
jgi:hypothetical protein